MTFMTFLQDSKVKETTNSSEATTETIFKNICYFLPWAPFSRFFQEALCIHRADTNFPGRYFCSPNRYHISRKPIYLFTKPIPIAQEHFLITRRRYRFSRSTFLATEHSKKPFSNINEQIGNSRIPYSEQIFQQKVSVAAFDSSPAQCTWGCWRIISITAMKQYCLPGVYVDQMAQQFPKSAVHQGPSKRIRYELILTIEISTFAIIFFHLITQISVQILQRRRLKRCHWRTSSRIQQNRKGTIKSCHPIHSMKQETQEAESNSDSSDAEDYNMQKVRAIKQECYIA